MGSFSPSQLPLRNASPILIPFLSLFFFCSTQLCQEFLALFGGLSSSASIQLMFCANSFTCRCVFFDVFVGDGVRELLLLHIFLRPPQILFLNKLYSKWGGRNFTTKYISPKRYTNSTIQSIMLREIYISILRKSLYFQFAHS